MKVIDNYSLQYQSCSKKSCGLELEEHDFHSRDVNFGHDASLSHIPVLTIYVHNKLYNFPSKNKNKINFIIF